MKLRKIETRRTDLAFHWNGFAPNGVDDPKFATDFLVVSWYITL